MNWREKAFKKHLNLKEMLIVSLFPISFIISIIIANRFFWWSFSWQDINPIEQPQPFVRLLYSALVYITLWAVLYSVGFYWGLYQTIGRLFGYGAYLRAKTFIWGSMIGIMYFIIIPAVINFLNFLLSLCFNTYQFFLQSFPLLGLSFGISAILFGMYHYIQKKEPVILNENR